MIASQIGFNPDYSEDAPSFEDIEASKETIVLEFGAPWCGYCQGASRLIEDALKDKSYRHVKVFDGKGKKLGRQFKVKLWPTLICLKEGKEVARVVRPANRSEVEALFVF